MASVHFKLKHVLVLALVIFALIHAPQSVDAKKSKKSKTPAPTPTSTPTPTPTTATVVSLLADEDSASASSATTTAAASNGTCTFSEPTTYITKDKLDWLWTNRLASYVPGDKMWIFDQLIAGKGNLDYCVRWDSKATLTKATATKIAPMLQRQLNQWNDWLKGYGCWPHDSVTVNIAGWATNDTSLFDWTDDSLGHIFSDQVDYDNIPVCNLNCYKHRDGLSTNVDLASCEGTPYDIYLQLTGGLGFGGFGYDWGQQVDQESTLEQVDQETLHIVAHEMGHGFGLPDFYETSDEPASGWPNCIMKAGSSTVINDADGWMLRWVWQKIYTRYFD